MAIDYDHESRQFREHQTHAQRTAKARLNIDPGFVHHRKIESFIGRHGINLVNAMVEKIPSGLPDYQRQLQVDHIYARVLVDSCAINGIPPLIRALAAEDVAAFCSVETCLPTDDLRDAARATTDVVAKGDSPFGVRLEYSTRHIVADTMWTRLANGAELAMVATLKDRAGDTFTFEPLLMGGPMLAPAAEVAIPDAMFLGFAFGELFVDDIDEFAEVRQITTPQDWSAMENISEHAFKTCLAEILGQDAPKDWGGEQSDLYSAHLHIHGERVAGAFLLKGPAKFRPMTLNMLGKNNDQIVRLAQEPAKLLVVQHCHDISPPVRATLRAFTIQPGTLDRRYCCIDGKDSLRILQAYDKLEEALKRSGKEPD